MSRGQPPMQWYLDEPDALPSHSFMIDEFWELSTERQLGFAVGPIPRSAIQKRAEELGLSTDGAAFDVFKSLTRALDNEFRSWVEKEREKNKNGGLPDQGGRRPRGRKVRYKGR